MAIRKIAQLGEPVLRQVARPLRSEELSSAYIARLIEDLVETMRDADGAGLAAPQIYESVQLVAIEVRHNPRYPGVDSIPLLVLVNPEITPVSTGPVEALAEDETIRVYEGCLSVAGVRAKVQRPRKVRVNALDRHGQSLNFIWEGFRAAVVQHEVDHLQGVLFVDRAETRTLAFIREYERYVPTSERIVDGRALE